MKCISNRLASRRQAALAGLCLSGLLAGCGAAPASDAAASEILFCYNAPCQTDADCCPAYACTQNGSCVGAVECADHPCATNGDCCAGDHCSAGHCGSAVDLTGLTLLTFDFLPAFNLIPQPVHLFGSGVVLGAVSPSGREHGALTGLAFLAGEGTQSCLGIDVHGTLWLTLANGDPITIAWQVKASAQDVFKFSATGTVSDGPLKGDTLQGLVLSFVPTGDCLGGVSKLQDTLSFSLLAP